MKQMQLQQMQLPHYCHDNQHHCDDHRQEPAFLTEREKTAAKVRSDWSKPQRLASSSPLDASTEDQLLDDVPLLYGEDIDSAELEQMVCIV